MFIIHVPISVDIKFHLTPSPLVRFDPRAAARDPQAGGAPDQGDPGCAGRQVEGRVSQPGEGRKTITMLIQQERDYKC